MKLNDNYSNKKDFQHLNKFDFSKNDSFGLLIQNKNSKNANEKKNNINELNADPRLELTLKYLDIISTLPTFTTNNIFFNDLLLLSRNDLIELGFSLVERNRILNFSQEFKKFGKKYNIQEINKFFSEFQNLNMRLISFKNNNIQSIQFNEQNEIGNNYINNINNENNKSNKKKLNYNNINYDNIHPSITNTNNTNNDSSYINEKNFQRNSSNKKNSIDNKHNLFSRIYINKYQLNKINYNLNNNDIQLMNNNISSNKIKNHKNYPEIAYQKSLNSKIANNNINHNYSQNYQEIDSNKLVRQNSKTSKNSNYSKNSKSRLATISKSFLPPSTSSGTIVQKYQDLTDEIDNYFKKYNDYQENTKNKKKKYQMITSSNHNKRIYIQILKNNIKSNNKIFIDKTKNNNLNNTNTFNSLNYNINFNENNSNNNINNELQMLKLKELQKKKQDLKERLISICDKENKKKEIVNYLNGEDYN